MDLVSLGLFSINFDLTFFCSFLFVSVKCGFHFALWYFTWFWVGWVEGGGVEKEEEIIDSLLVERILLTCFRISK